mmetsp:Transcript_29514/g.45050  ORF Transcript_29514/g.45050 Transcript_29514/m.45050 type:complete len:440 (+) Transcript_29514:29-1348(+)
MMANRFRFVGVRGRSVISNFGRDGWNSATAGHKRLFSRAGAGAGAGTGTAMMTTSTRNISRQHKSTHRGIRNFSHFFSGSFRTAPFKSACPSFSSNCRTRTLHHEWIVDGKVYKAENYQPGGNEKRETIIFLHGLLGNNKNLRTPAKKLTKDNPNFHALMMDLRGHGASPAAGIVPYSSSSPLSSSSSLSSSHEYSHPTINNCANDVIHTVQALNLTGSSSPIGIVGHSFGGRCALTYHHTLCTTGDVNVDTDKETVVNPPQHCFILDSVPGMAHASVDHVLRAIESVPIPIASKKDLVQFLTQDQNVSKAIAHWMTTNLRSYDDQSASTSSGNKGGFEFTFDMSVARGVLDDFPQQDMLLMIRDCVSVSDADSINRTIHKIMASKTGAWTDEMVDELEEIQSDYFDDRLKLVTLDAGHWVHIDDLEGLMVALRAGFDR